MPKRKKIVPIPDYIGTGKNQEIAYVEKSRPLQSLAETDLSLPEFKILDAYLARINSHDSEKRTVRFEKGELECYLGVSRILKDDLDKRLRNLFQVIEVKDDNKRKGFKLINLFEEADAEPDDNGLWQITLTCTPSAREYIFNIDNIGYLRYRLKNVINLTSRYSYILFLYLVDNRFRKRWTISLDELKKLLNCTAETYNQYKRFNDLILKKCHKELLEKTDLRFSYETIKKGRTVVEIQFAIETLSEELLEVTSLDQEIKPPSAMYPESKDDHFERIIDFLADACNNEFSRDEMVEIFEIICTMPLPVHSDGIELARFHYLSEVYARLNVAAKKKNISSRYNYLKKILLSEKNSRKDKPDNHVT